MRMKLGLIGAAAGMILATLPLDARALSSVSLLWPANGTNEIVAAVGEEIDLAIVISAGPEGVTSYGVSIEFDSDLDFVSANELAPSPFSNLNAGVGPPGADESAIGTNGNVFTFEGVTFGAGAADTTFLIGTIRFRVVAPLSDGPDVSAGFFNQGIDGMFDNLGNPSEVVFGSASVTPEPGTVLLLGAGLAALAGARRDRRS